MSVYELSPQIITFSMRWIEDNISEQKTNIMEDLDEDIPKRKAT